MGKLFDIEKGRKLRDASIAQVDAAAHRHWKNCALDAVIGVALERKQFTTDHCHQKLLDFYPEAWTHELRAWGAIMREASSLGICRATDRFWKSARPVAHRGPKMVWISLVI